MPANLTPEYRRAEKEFRAAKTPHGKLACLEHMLRVMPKHKGTDHMQADLKRRISRLREQNEHKSGKAKRAPVSKVEKEGAGQIVLLGAPNSGKSQLLAALSNAHVNVADYPFSTHLPQPGMMHFEDVQIQLVDTPPVTADYMEMWMPDTVRRADRALLVVDLGNDTLLACSGNLEIEDSESGERLLSGDYRVAANSCGELGRLRICRGEQRVLLLRWNSEGKTWGNHYLLGSPPFDFSWYRSQMHRIASLAPSFDAECIGK